MRRRGMRGGRPGLVGTVARTAVIAGTATAVSNKVTDSQQAKAQQAANAQAYEQQVAAQAAPPPPEAAPEAPAAPAEDPMISKLKQLADLHAQGILTDEEFSAQKAKILG